MNAAPSAGLAQALRGLDRDGRLLFTTRVIRMFGYGFLAVVLALYLAARGFDGVAIGIILTLTLVGDTLISLWLTTHADRYGRRLVLIVGALLMAAAGIVFAATDLFGVLVAAAIVGVISPSGNEVGPFLAVEQAALSQTTPGVRRTPVFAWYNLAGSIATAVGSLAGGLLASALQGAGETALDSYRGIVIGYAAVGILLAIGFARVSRAVEAPAVDPSAREGVGRLGLRPASRSVVLKLAGLFSIDAFGGGLVPQSLLAYWFHLRFGV
ncbi:MAG: MFS transporter, partial [Chloroflexota bacterium]